MSGTLDLNGKLGIVEQNGKWYLAQRGDIHHSNRTNSWELSGSPLGEIAQYNLGRQGEFFPLSSFSLQGQVITDSMEWTTLYGNDAKVVFNPSIYDLAKIGDIFYQLTGSVDNTVNQETFSVRLTHANDALIETPLSGGAVIESSGVVQSDDPLHDEEHGVEIQVEGKVTDGNGYFRGGVVTVFGKIQ